MSPEIDEVLKGPVKQGSAQNVANVDHIVKRLREEKKAREARKLIPKSVTLSKEMIETLDILVEAGLYGCRAEAIRMAVRDLIDRELPIAVKMLKKRKGRAGVEA